MITIVLIDDHDLVRIGIKKMLQDIQGIKVVGEARNGEEGLKIIREHKPNVILMDVKMPGIGGLEAIQKLLHSDPDAKVIVVSVFDNDLFPTQLIRAGALGYITKSASIEEMVQAIRAVQAGQRYVSPQIANLIALKRLNDHGSDPFDDLSERELQVMLMIIKGVKAPEISEKLRLSPKTVNSYRYRIFEKLQIANDVELTHLAIQHDFLESEEVDDME